MNPIAEFAWIAAPAAALVVACALLVPLGAEVLRRGVVFIDLAVAQVAALGVLLATMGMEGATAPATTLAAVAASLLGATLVWWLARRWPGQREALIGLVYVASSAAAVVVVASDPHGRERLAALLAADVLWVSWPAVATLAVVTLAGAVLVARHQSTLQRDTVFYPVFAIALAVSVQSLGLYLVFALLIGPALWTLRGCRLRVAIVAGVVACMGGLATSWVLDGPSGACVAVALCGLGLLSVFASGAKRADV
jgi:zinc/manganese transport system permease protein